MKVHIILYEGEIVSVWADKSRAKKWVEDANKWLKEHGIKEDQYFLHTRTVTDLGKQHILDRWVT